MSIWQIAWGYLWSRKFITTLTILSVALGVALISSVLTLRAEMERRFIEEGQSFDAVIGHKGSPLQLVLSCVYFIDIPPGNISWSDYEDALNHEWVKAAFPISLGDTFRTFRIVGTSLDLFDHEWISPVTGETTRPYEIAEGRKFQKPFEAVVGSFVAKTTGLIVGDQFIGRHGAAGEDHEEHPYTVVGILRPSSSPNDHAIFCDLESIWQSHEHLEEGEGEPETGQSLLDDHDHDHDGHDHEDGHEHAEDRAITAVLVNLESPGHRFQYRDEFRTANVMAAIPIMEIQKMFDQFLTTAQTILLAVGYLVVVVSSITIMIGLYMSIQQRRRDLAVMRALGAGAADIFGAVLVEALLVTALGIVAGWMLGNIGTWLVSQYLTREYGLDVRSFTLSFEELKAFAAVALVGYLAGIIPAFQAYRRDVARDLAEL